MTTIPSGSDGTQISGYPSTSSLLVDDLFVLQRQSNPGPVGTVSVTFTALVAAITASIAVSRVFPPLPNAPNNPFAGQAYFDTTLGYPLVFGGDGNWHGIRLTD